MTHIRGSHSRIISLLGIITIAAFGIMSTLGSGGGGGDGDSSTPVQPLAYDGNVDPAIITKDNATTLISNVLFGNMASGAIPVGVAELSPSQPPEGTMLIEHFTPLFSISLNTIVSSNDSQLPLGVDVPVSGTLLCDNGPNATFEGTLDNVTFLGTVTYTYSNCLLGNLTYTGTAIVTFHVVDVINLFPTSFTMDFSPRMTIVSSDKVLNMSATGTIWLLIDFDINKDTVTMNFVSRNNNTGNMSKYAGFVITTAYDVYDIFTLPNEVLSQTYSGRAFDYTHGYVDVITAVAMAYSNMMLLFPDSGGPVYFDGADVPDAGLMRIQLMVSAADPANIEIDLDLDGDGNYELGTFILPWTALLNPQPLP